MAEKRINEAALARALYETEPGSNGYPPLHTTLAWDDVGYPEVYIARARQIADKLARSGEERE